MSSKKNCDKKENVEFIVKFVKNILMYVFFLINSHQGVLFSQMVHWLVHVTFTYRVQLITLCGS